MKPLLVVAPILITLGALFAITIGKAQFFKSRPTLRLGSNLVAGYTMGCGLGFLIIYFLP